jgi:hypothetical protein
MMTTEEPQRPQTPRSEARDSMVSTQSNTPDTDMRIDHSEINQRSDQATYRELISKSSSEWFLKIASNASSEQQT